MHEYRVIKVESEFAVGVLATEEMTGTLLATPPGTKWLASHRLYDAPDYWPEQLPPAKFSLAPHMLPDIAKGAAAFNWGSFFIVSEEVRGLFEKHLVEGFYSPAEIRLDDHGSKMDMNLFFPSLAIDAIDRQLSIYSEEEGASQALAIGTIERLELDQRKLTTKPSLFQLGATSQDVLLAHVDLCEELNALTQYGLTCRGIKDCTWDY